MGDTLLNNYEQDNNSSNEVKKYAEEFPGNGLNTAQDRIDYDTTKYIVSAIMEAVMQNKDNTDNSLKEIQQKEIGEKLGKLGIDTFRKHFDNIPELSSKEKDLKEQLHEKYKTEFETLTNIEKAITGYNNIFTKETDEEILTEHQKIRKTLEPLKPRKERNDGNKKYRSTMLKKEDMNILEKAKTDVQTKLEKETQSDPIRIQIIKARTAASTAINEYITPIYQQYIKKTEKKQRENKQESHI